MEINSALEEIGLTCSEIKVYLALLKLEFSTKGPILDEAKIAQSKIYDVLNKLMIKGLVSMIIKDGVRHYEAAPLERIKDYLKEKKIKLEKEEKTVDLLMPLLSNLKKSKQQTSAEIFLGWKGIENVYSTLLDKMKKKEVAYILGASKGTDVERTKNFFFKYGKRAREKGVITQVIFNQDSRAYVQEIEKEAKIKLNKRFLFKATPVEIAIAKEHTGIVILKEEPIVILIKDKETAESFVTYFKELWKIAKN